MALMVAVLAPLVGIAVLSVPISILVWVVRYLREISAERRRLRLEVSKMAHELENLRSAAG